MQTFKDLWKSYSWLYFRLAQAIMVIFVFVAVVMLMTQEGVMKFDSVALQARIKKNDQLGLYVEQKINWRPTSQHNRYYQLGFHYSSAIAQAISKNPRASLEQLQFMRDLLPQAKEIHQIIDQFPPALQREDKKTLIMLFRLLQENCEKLSDEIDKIHTYAFQWGSWLVDVYLVLEASDRQVIFQFRNLFVRQANYFKQRLDNIRLQNLFSDFSIDIMETPVKDETLFNLKQVISEMAQIYQN